MGLVFSLPENLRDIYKGFKILLPEYNGDDSWELPMPTRLIVDQSGKIIYANTNPDYTDRPEPTETLEVLKSFSGNKLKMENEDV